MQDSDFYEKNKDTTTPITVQVSPYKFRYNILTTVTTPDASCKQAAPNASNLQKDWQSAIAKFNVTSKSYIECAHWNRSTRSSPSDNIRHYYYKFLTRLVK